MKTYDFCFGCGFSCGVTQALRAANLQFASLPFDWTATPSFLKAAQMVAGEFAHWMDRADLDLVDIHYRGMNKRVYANRRTGFGFVHDFSLFLSEDEAYRFETEKYRRRAQRLDAELRRARRVLAVCVEWPFLPRLTDATLAETRRTFAAKYPDTAFDLLYFHVADGARAAAVESAADGVTVVGCEYRKFLPDGELHHEIDNAQIADFLKANVAMPDPRTAEAKAKYAADWKRQDAARWKGHGPVETIVNRTAFRLYRKLEKFLTRKGLVPPERPRFFVTSDEPR